MTVEIPERITIRHKGCTKCHPLLDHSTAREYKEFATTVWWKFMKKVDDTYFLKTCPCNRGLATECSPESWFGWNVFSSDNAERPCASTHCKSVGERFQLSALMYHKRANKCPTKTNFPKSNSLHFLDSWPDIKFNPRDLTFFVWNMCCYRSVHYSFLSCGRFLTL